MIPRIPRIGRVALLLLVLAACSREPKPDLLLITVDTLRADHLGSYGYAAARTPYMDLLAREGVRFTQCMTPAPITLPAHASMLTGQLPSEHGVRDNLSFALPASARSVAEDLRAAGYRTAAFVSAFPLDARFGLDQGFEHYDDAMPAAQSSFVAPERSAPMTLQLALKWLASAPKEEPVFLWVHLFEPHIPYTPPPQLAEAFAHPYDGEIAATDAAIRVLLAGFHDARAAQPITILTSDHGEGLGEHEEDTHAFFLFESTLHIPLIVHAPGVWPAGIVEEPVSLCDVAPTLRAFAGLSPVAAFGQALQREGMPRRALYAESLYGMYSFGWSPVFARREGAHKLIRSTQSRAYDLATDPQETQDLWPSAPLWAQTEMDDLEAQVRSASVANPEATRGVHEGESEALAALGYISGSAPTPADSDLLSLMDRLPDGTGQREEFLAVAAAQTEILAQRYADALPHLQRALQANPRNGFAQSLLASSQDAMGELELSAASFERALQLQPLQLDTRINAARVFWRSGRTSMAAEHFRAALEMDPQRLSLLREAAPVLVAAGEVDALLEFLRQRIDASGAASVEERVELHALYALSCLQSGRGADALPQVAAARKLADSPRLRVIEAQAERTQQHWDRVLELLEPLSPELEEDAQAHLLLALAHDQKGEPTVAIPSYRRTLALEERQPVAHSRLAVLLLESTNDAEAALPHAARAVELAVDEASYHEFYVDLLEKLGKPAIARSHVRRFAGRFVGNPIFDALKARYGLQ